MLWGRPFLPVEKILFLLYHSLINAKFKIQWKDNKSSTNLAVVSMEFVEIFSKNLLRSFKASVYVMNSK